MLSGFCEQDYDGKSVIEERRADGTLLAHYRYADRLFRLDTETDSQYYHHDALGSTVNLTGSDGSLEVSYRIDPWGKIREQSGTTVNRHIFTGQEYDENTGLIYFKARLYESETARFVTQDPYLGQVGIPSSLHRYLYVYSNPTVFMDPTGNYVVDIAETNTFFRTDLSDPSIRRRLQFIQVYADANDYLFDKAIKELKAAYSHFKVNRKELIKNPRQTFLIVEKRKTDQDHLRTEIFDYMGKGFEEAYKSNLKLNDNDLFGIKDLTDYISTGREAGDMMNLTMLRMIRDSLTRKRTKKSLIQIDKGVYSSASLLNRFIYKYIVRDIYYNNAISNDPLTSEKEKGRAKASNFINAAEIGLIAGPLLYKGAKAGLTGLMRYTSKKKVKVVNIGGPFDNVISRRSLRDDYLDINLTPTNNPNTVIADVNKVNLTSIAGKNVEVLRASNVPFVEVSSGAYVKPDIIVGQAKKLGVKYVVISTGKNSVSVLSEALRSGGYSVKVREIGGRYFVTAKAP